MALADGQAREPVGVELAGADGGLGLRREVAVALEDLAGDLQVLVDGLAGDQQVHDLGRALEDAVDAHVAQRRLDGHRLLAARLERLGGLVAAAAADLHQLVERPASPCSERVELRDRRLDADVVLLVVGQAGGDVEHRLEAERGRGDEGDLLRDGVVLADRLAPLDPLAPTTRARSSSPTWRCRRRSRAARGGRC